MKCPVCGEWVPATQATCPKCHRDLTLLHALDYLRAGARQTRADCERVASQVRELDDRLESLESLVVSGFSPATPPHPPSEAPEARPIPVAPPTAGSRGAPPPADAAPRVGHSASAGWSATPIRISEIRLGQKWLLIVGIVITVLAVGYFLKYSFDRNWVGPAGRVALAYLAGLAMLGAGEGLRRRGFDAFGLYIVGGGIAVLYFASYAAFQFYHLMTQPLAFALMVIVTSLAGAFSLFYDTKWLAVLGIIGGFLTPVVLDTGTDDQVALMTYMTILNGGILGIALFKQWALLNYLGLCATWLLFTVWFVNHYSDESFWTTTIFLNAFFLTYSCVPFAPYLARRGAVRVVGFALTIPNAYVAFGYSFATIERRFSVEWVAVATLAYATILLSMATYLFRTNRRHYSAFILLLSNGLLFLAITVPILFSEYWITVFWALQGVVLLWAALRLGEHRLGTGAVLLLLVAVGRLFVYDYPVVFHLRLADLAFYDGFRSTLAGRWTTAFVCLLALFVAAGMLKAAARRGSRWDGRLPALFYLVFGLALFAVANIEVAGFFYEYAPAARFAAVSVLWAVFAAGLMVVGFARRLVLARGVAIALFAATVVKVFVRDMANVETPHRILSFLVVGLLLVAASYLYHRYASRILPISDDSTETV